MSYICKDCGAVFTDGDMYNDAGDYSEACPTCGSGHYEDSAWCKNCRSIKPKSTVVDCICDECASAAAKTLYLYINGYAFTEPEREYIKNLLKGII